jgi:hypothetical protein
MDRQSLSGLRKSILDSKKILKLNTKLKGVCIKTMRFINSHFGQAYTRINEILSSSAQLKGVLLNKIYSPFFSFDATAPIWALLCLYETLRFTSVYQTLDFQ